MLNRRQLLQAAPASALFGLISNQTAHTATAAGAPAASPVLASPPVIQFPTADGFSVSFAVNKLATGWVEWGLSSKQLNQKAQSVYGGLLAADEHALVVPVSLGEAGGAGRRIFYRVAAQPLAYENAYKLHRGEIEYGPVHSITLPDPGAAKVRVAVVNDTHDHRRVIALEAARVEKLAPDFLVWNGDTVDAFNSPAAPAQVLLSPGVQPNAPSQGGWAATRPLLFVAGNHDVRGANARDVQQCLASGPEPGLPHNFALRHGPLAMIGLDTGEDKPDAHPVFAGTAAYEPYREHQAKWLEKALQRPEIAAAPFKLAFCHIPFRGLTGQNDGQSLEGYAAWSGAGARLWMPLLRAAGAQAVVSGHTHQWRIDDSTPELPMQVVGGGPEPSKATVIVLDADAAKLTIVIQDLAGSELARRVIQAPA